MISNFPWLLLAVIVYNIIAFAFGVNPGPDGSGPNYFNREVLSPELISGALWKLSVGDLMIVFTLILLFVELVKATRTDNYSVVDHALSMVVFIICIIEFIAVPQAATSVFFIIIVVVLIDVVAGFTITIKAAKRDVAFGPGGH